MRLEDLDYELDPASISQQPAEPRESARLLVDGGPAAPPEHRTVAALPELVRTGDVVVVNTTRVRPARLRGQRPTGGAAEALLLEPRGDGWAALVRPSRKLPPGSRFRCGPGLEVDVGEHLPDDQRLVRLVGSGDDLADLDAHGEIPLPPYFHGVLDDPERYQTVYADRPVSVAAPTAGLHLTEAVLNCVRAAGAEVATVELAVGLGTFRPITASNVEDHVMHHEHFHVEPEVLEACARAERVIAVGTTTVRALEAAAVGGSEGATDLFIRPGYEFQVVDALLTNFHQPRSSLLALIQAFIGPRWRELYAEALARGYRFLSFGDAMFLPERT